MGSLQTCGLEMMSRENWLEWRLVAAFLLAGCELEAFILLGQSLSVERILLGISGSSILDVEMVVELIRC